MACPGIVQGEALLTAKVPVKAKVPVTAIAMALVITIAQFTAIAQVTAKSQVQVQGTGCSGLRPEIHHGWSQEQLSWLFKGRA